MSTPAGNAPPPSAAPKKQPSLYARKLLQKLSTLHPNASLESRQTIAAWMVFNRKKCEGMGEGLLVAAESASVDAGSSGGGDGTGAARLMLLLRIMHQVLLSDCPTVVAAAAGAGGAAEGGDADKWARSSQLRSRLGEIVLNPLWKALAASLSRASEDAREQYQTEVKKMTEEWREHDVFGGPTVWEEYKRGWIRALKEATGEARGGEGAGAGVSASVTAGAAETATKMEPVVDDIDKKSSERSQQSSASKEGKKSDVAEKRDLPTAAGNVAGEKPQPKDEPAAAAAEIAPARSSFEEGADGKAARAAKRDGVPAVDVEVNFEDIEEARVEPSRFLDACKVIASIQITRDLGSDAAMNLSSSLSKIPPEVEEACNAILTRREKGEDETPVAELLPTKKLSNLPDEVLDMDLKYARQSLQSYREAIRRQRRARLQCLRLLMESRCSFGSRDAAGAFCGGEGSDVNMEYVLGKLKKRKEILVDAMALEGLDVEEDEEEKRMEKEEDSLKPLSWFTEEKDGEAGEEPDAKKLKSC